MGVTRTPPVGVVWPDHHQAWDTWKALENAWNMIVGFGAMGYMGFDRAAAAAVMAMQGIPLLEQRQVLDNLLVMERAALPILNSK